MSQHPSLDTQAVEWQLPWGPVVRGIRMGSGADRALLLHEPGADIDAWAGLPRYLALRLPLQVIALDLPGHGLSDDPWEPAMMPNLMQAVLDETTGRCFVVAAGSIASAALTLPAQFKLGGVAALSPQASDETAIVRSPRTAKLFCAGSLAGDDVANARRLAESSGGWALVTTVPVAARGNGLLASPWRGQIFEQITVFLRDCLRADPTQHPSAPPPASAALSWPGHTNTV